MTMTRIATGAVSAALLLMTFVAPANAEGNGGGNGCNDNGQCSAWAQTETQEREEVDRAEQAEQAEQAQQPAASNGAVAGGGDSDPGYRLPSTWEEYSAEEAMAEWRRRSPESFGPTGLFGGLDDGSDPSPAPAALRDWLETKESHSVGQAPQGGESIGHKSGRQIVTILEKHRAELDDHDWAHMARIGTMNEGDAVFVLGGDGTHLGQSAYGRIVHGRADGPPRRHQPRHEALALGLRKVRVRRPPQPAGGTLGGRDGGRWRRAAPRRASHPRRARLPRP